MIGLVFMGLALLCSVVSLACWIMTLIKMFNDQEEGGVGKGIFGLICGLYAFIWGWQTAAKHDTKNIMMAWTGAFLGSILLNVVATAMAGAMAQ